MNRIQTMIASISVLALVAAVPVAAQQTMPSDRDSNGIYQRVDYTQKYSRPERRTLKSESSSAGSTNQGTNPGGTYYRDQGYSQSYGSMGADRGVSGYYEERGTSGDVGRNVESQDDYSNQAINERGGWDQSDQSNWHGMNPLESPFSSRDSGSPYPKWAPDQSAPSYYQPTYPRGTTGGQTYYDNTRRDERTPRTHERSGPSGNPQSMPQ